MSIRPLGPPDADHLGAFFATLSERDLTLIREELSDPRTVEDLIRGGSSWVAVDESAHITGYVGVARLPGWSDHVGELRLVVGPSHRGQGLGRSLAQHALTRSLARGISKVVIELAVDQEGAASMFANLGFTGEALLQGHIRDRDGRLHDVIVLAHHAHDTWSAIDAVGIADALQP
ncbi:GNAT family N-acetyltransferase [Rhodococcus sp. KRD162]|uniref:GNAT family N-acetyltransferase n=1 Tax=Rhodococcus sp. KRD162 TaxID=2729725 RepID=UPI0019D2520C|nr:GNAT family N-acetyltransferase [Rhodococcus sp. KRD162]